MFPVSYDTPNTEHPKILQNWHHTLGQYVDGQDCQSDE